MLFKLIEKKVARIIVAFLFSLSLLIIYILDMISIGGKIRLATISLFLLIFVFTPSLLDKYGLTSKDDIKDIILRHQFSRRINSLLESSKWCGIVFAVVSIICVSFWDYLVARFGILSIQIPILALAYFILEYSLIEFSIKVEANDGQ